MSYHSNKMAIEAQITTSLSVLLLFSQTFLIQQLGSMNCSLIDIIWWHNIIHLVWAIHFTNTFQVTWKMILFTRPYRGCVFPPLCYLCWVTSGEVFLMQSLLLLALDLGQATPSSQVDQFGYCLDSVIGEKSWLLNKTKLWVQMPSLISLRYIPTTARSYE